MGNAAMSETPIMTKQPIPKTVVDTIQALIGAVTGVQDNLLCYIETGDISFARHAINHLMLIRAMDTKTLLSKFIGRVVLNETPLSDEERQQLAKMLS